MGWFSSIKQIIRRYPHRFLFGLFIIAWLVASFIFYLRFPNNFLFPNFFAEDGQHFTQNIIDKGFLGGLLTPFNGYFIFGIYLITEFGFIINAILYNGNFVNLPESFALASYAFLGLCAVLPIILLKKYIALPYRIVLAFLIVLLPFPSFDYATIGTIGNLKFAFNFIAILLVLYRITLSKNSRKNILVDLLLLLCAYTTAGVYLILPIIIFSDGLQLYKKSVYRHIKRLFTKNNISLWSGSALLTLCVAQVAFILINGVPKLTGYLDEPYQIAKTIEVFIARPFLYPFISALYHNLNDIIVVALFTFMVFIAFRFGQRNHWKIYIILLLSILTTTLVFVINRTGTAFYYNSYHTTGFDNFFYAQNFISLLFAIIVLSDISKRLTGYWKIAFPVVISLGLILCSARTNSTYAPNDFMQYKIGTIHDQVKPLCKDKTNAKITFSVYPFTFLTMTEPRDLVCTNSVSKSKTLIQNFKLYATSNTAMDIYPGTSKFKQTFIANQNNLLGIGVYLGTYGVNRINNFDFQLFDEDCTTIIRQVQLPRYAQDNTIRRIDFKAVSAAKDKRFCFTITPTQPSTQKLAIWLSDENIYKDGLLKINNIDNTKDVVFYPQYK